MLSLTIFMLATHIINACYSTRLPLEVYELTPNAAGGTDLKHKNLEYSTINGGSGQHFLAVNGRSKQQHVSASMEEPELKMLSSHDSKATATKTLTVSSMGTPSAAATTTTSSTSTATATTTNQLDRRRSRQMLDIMQKNHHDQTGNHKLPPVLSSGEGAATGASHSQKDVRILYQVGNSEDDLPICAPNAVCSKIDLYETPWIERQCRCPAVNRSPEIIIHHHHKETVSHSNHNSEKYHTFYEHSKLAHQQQNKHLLLDAASFVGDKKFDNLHLKKLMHKLGAVYEDDLNLPSDYHRHEETNSALDDSNEATLYYADEIKDNEFPAHFAMKRQHLYSNTPHMRHSGHTGGGHGGKISYIGGCPSGLGIEDGHTIADKTRHYKMCQPVHRLPVCRHFRDYTWTLTTSPEMNTTEQIVHCRCPKNSVTYLTKREPSEDGNGGYKYLFACSPLTRLRCQRKQPCKLFTVRKRQEFIDEVNINALCQCPKGHHCPSHHTQSGVIAGETFLEDNIQTYSGYCMVND
ncbi:protein giant-lens isoform X1 [Musca domestica]|uniref:Protein giant-lens isoform X1 n=1 Tax=Musca domestica TaxID=7370 RepID=A0A9J7IG38_MUSDO|nr:protein giant-lens isoform X1 [Musca domestica]XP_058980373.1 protein giant-lens isoform X1 [Musca domestica]